MVFRHLLGGLIARAALQQAFDAGHFIQPLAAAAARFTQRDGSNLTGSRQSPQSGPVDRILAFDAFRIEPERVPVSCAFWVFTCPHAQTMP